MYIFPLQVDEVDGRFNTCSSLSKPHATSTPYSNPLPNGCYNDQNLTSTTSTANNNSARRQLLSEKENEKEAVNQEALQVYIDVSLF